jgi:hypothetical protein
VRGLGRHWHTTLVRLARSDGVVGLASRVMAEEMARCTHGERLGRRVASGSGQAGGPGGCRYGSRLGSGGGLRGRRDS